MDKRKDTLYQVDLCGGYCCIITAQNIQQAYNQALRENGTRNLAGVHRATEEEVASARAMGAFIPDGRISRKTKGKT